MILTGLEAIGFSKYKFKQTTIVIALTVHCIACGTEGSSLREAELLDIMEECSCTVKKQATENNR